MKLFDWMNKHERLTMAILVLIVILSFIPMFCEVVR